MSPTPAALADGVDIQPPPAAGPAAAEAGAEAHDESERPKRGDKPPRKRGPKRPSPNAGKTSGAALKAQSARLERKLAELLTFPAVPAMMLAPAPESKAYLCEHFTRSGPPTAAALVEASESSPELRALLERITTGGSLLTVVIALIAYAAPPIMWSIGMREQAVRMTQATTMDEETLARMMAEANADAAASADAAGPSGAEASAVAD